MLALFISSICNLLARSIAYEVLSRKGMNVVVAVLGVEIGLFFIIKALRHDLLYWASMYGVAGYIVAFFIRLIEKVLVDWTFLVQLRHPNEVGGILFCFR